MSSPHKNMKSCNRAGRGGSHLWVLSWVHHWSKPRDWWKHSSLRGPVWVFGSVSKETSASRAGRLFLALQILPGSVLQAAIPSPLHTAHLTPSASCCAFWRASGLGKYLKNTSWVPEWHFCSFPTSLSKSSPSILPEPVAAPEEEAVSYPCPAQTPSGWMWMKKWLPAPAAPLRGKGDIPVLEQDSYIKAVGLLLL